MKAHPQSIPGRGWVGLYPFAEVRHEAWGFTFFVRGTSFVLESRGFAYCPGGEVAADHERYTALSGGWYAWRNTPGAIHLWR